MLNYYGLGTLLAITCRSMKTNNIFTMPQLYQRTACLFIITSAIDLCDNYETCRPVISNSEDAL